MIGERRVIAERGESMDTNLALFHLLLFYIYLIVEDFRVLNERFVMFVDFFFIHK